MPGFNLADYEPVEERLARFWVDHPEGRIVTDLVGAKDGNYIVRAEVYRLPPVIGATLQDGVQLPDATGYAQEREGSSPVNKTSALENCETSAIGRALANLGYAPKGQRPSREEMTKASGRGQLHTGSPDAATSTSSVPSSTSSGNPTAAEDRPTSTGAATTGKGSAPVGTSRTAHAVHKWKPAPREGFLVCECGRTKKVGE